MTSVAVPVDISRGKAEENRVEITDIRLRAVSGDGKLRAYAAVTFDESFVVHNIKVIHGRDGVFIAMPSRKTSDGEFRDIAHPITTEFRARLQSAVLDAWYESTAEQDRGAPPAY